MGLAREEKGALRLGQNKNRGTNHVEPTEVLFAGGMSVCVLVRGVRSEPAPETNGSLPRGAVGVFPRHPRGQSLEQNRLESAGRTETRSGRRFKPVLQEIL